MKLKKIHINGFGNIENREIDIKDGIIVKMGRAKNMKNAVKEDTVVHGLSNYSPSEHSFSGIISIDPIGEVIRCDYEYDKLNEQSIGNILQKPLEQIIYERCVEELKQGKSDINYDDEESVKQAIDLAYSKRNRIPPL